MKLYYRDRVPSNEPLLEWQWSDNSDTRVGGVEVHWQIGSPLAWLVLISVSLAENWSEGHSSGEVALRWSSLIETGSKKWTSSWVAVEWQQWHKSGLSGSALTNWLSIGWLQIWLMQKIYPKSRPLIGRELRILASDWSRGLSENLQRGYPYDI